ncbi:phenylpyruvate tautomerase PptA (4-oxalocrotonate tautomerase family) [Bacilli bacterium PM5-3]|nr:phenylpyruvate tautomerase PptA (4-oxalocrotonate tautomerase family) [Bacilli bacterium PM5-3]MDH6604147.1 phenylpyruvate tautomerase PptA (4-oxalocrotonate tautomerase family) [Bacilli bacterium PM5-9]
MPTIKIDIVPLDYNQKVELAKSFCDELHRVTGIDKDATIVFFNEYPPENVAPGGVLLVDKEK